MELEERIDILLVSADPELGDQFAEHLASAGHPATVRPPGQDEGDPRAILLFVVRNGRDDDLEALEGWVKSCPESDVIALLDGEAAGRATAALARGATMCLSLATPPDALAQVLDHALARQSRRLELEATRRRYGEIIDQVPIGIFEIRDGRISAANGQLIEKLGYTREELLGVSAMEVIAPQDRERANIALERRSRGEKSESPGIYRFIGKDGSLHVGKALSRPLGCDGRFCIEGVIQDVTQEARLAQLQGIVLELGEIILGEQEIDRILQHVLDAITEYSGFQRALLSLYDLSLPVPFEGEVHKTLASGLSAKEFEAILAQPPMPVAQRRLAFADRFKLGPAYYIPHDDTPWSAELGITGTVTIDGWHKDDYLFIPLRGIAGIIGSISVDDPLDKSVPTLASIAPVATLANFAALAVERLYKFRQLQKQKEQLRGLSGFGRGLSRIEDVATLCELAAQRICGDMNHDFCAIWVVDGAEIALQGIVHSGGFPAHEIPTRGTRLAVEGGGIPRLALQHGEPIVIPDVDADPRYQRSRESIRSMAALPIMGRKGALGIVDVESLHPAAFGEDHLEVLSALISQLAVTISDLQLRESLSHIYAFGQRLATARSVDHVVVSTLDFLMDQFRYQLGAIFLSAEGGQLSLAGIRGPCTKEEAAAGWPLPKGVGIVGWVARNRQSALVSDVTSDPRYHRSCAATRSELDVPVLFSDHLLGVLNIESPVAGFFDDEDRQLLEVIATQTAIALTNLASQEELREQVVRDPLTELYNRHYFNSMIAPELSRSDRYQRPITLMMIDVDGFRAVNNRMGHLKGDKILQEVAQLLSENVRASDRVIRYGGDEFLIFMPETVDEGEQVAARLRKQIVSVPRRAGIEDFPIGLSIGIYTRHPQDSRSVEGILEEVDRRMYADKRAHRGEGADDYRC